MTIEEARDVLGFPPGFNPSNSELVKAWKTKARENHPDRGGDNRAMVEINVAKEVLEGTRVNDKTEVRNDVKQRRLDLSAILAAKALATSVLARLIEANATRLFSSGRIDLREYLTDDFAEIVDKLHDVAEISVRKATGKRLQRMKDIVGHSKTTLAQASRVSAKLRDLSKRTNAAAISSASIESVTQLCDDLGKYKNVFEGLHKASGKMNELLAHAVSDDDDDEIVPDQLSEAFQDCRQMVSAFRYDYFHYSHDCDVKSASREVESAVSDVLEILRRRQAATSGLPAWDRWNAETFEHAITLMDRRTNASRRVAARYLARQS